MANGKIKADTLEHSTARSLDTQYVVNGSAKAWCKFGPDAQPDDSFNIASGTDVAVGQYRHIQTCLLYTSPSPRDRTRSRMPSSA